MQTHAPSFNFLCLMGLEKGLKIHSMEIVFIGNRMILIFYNICIFPYCTVSGKCLKKPLESQALELNDLKVIY